MSQGFQWVNLYFMDEWSIVSTLSSEETSAYYKLKLLFIKQKDDREELLNEKKLFAMCLACSQKEKKAIRKIMEQFYKNENGEICNSKLQELIEKAEKAYQQRVFAGECSKKARLKNQDKEKKPENHNFVRNDHFNIVNTISVQSLQKAKDNAPRWDIYHLSNIYNDAVKSGRLKKPDYPDAAFINWCKKFTKGKPPS